MKNKDARKNLEKKVQELKKTTVTYKQAKENLKGSLEMQEGTEENSPEPNMAVEVLEQTDSREQPVEKALIAEHIFRKTIEESIPCGILGFDMQGKQIYVNRVFCEMVGWPEKDLVGAKFPFKYLPLNDLKKAVAKFQILLSGEVPLDGIELPFQRKNGDRFWGIVLSATLTNSKGNKIGHLMSVADISARKNAEKALRVLSSRLITAQETERKLVSQDLHDSIGGKLTGLKYSLEKIISDLENVSYSLETSLKDVLSIVQSTIEETQRITKNLHPSILDDLGLFAAIREICREFKEVYTDITITSHFETDERDVPVPLRILIFRILQEALNNIAKHSRADAVTLSLKKDKRKIVLTIEDNGKGFDLHKEINAGIQERGMGLQSMRERTELLGGSIEFRSEQGKGTTVCADWPV
ncbi:MAG: PAS domain-containing sensor histidine kinase [Desulfobacteraceae bacterium]|jgi:PAS domain S-box-containing protein|nr:PAS domain-containing sensor histidine kinase [Desulfobacteraceae bacterium]